MTDMKLAYRAAAIAVRQRLFEYHPQQLKQLNRIQIKQVAVYSGTFDQVEEILRGLKIPFLLNPKAETTPANIIFVNCSNSYNPTLVNHLKKQVESGKWLISSDWGLGYLIAPAFPGMVRWNHKSTRDEVISVEPSLDSLWSEVVVLGTEPQWWLEGSSHPIEILNPEKVKIEAASHELLTCYSAPVVAVSFDWGKGHVFHVISHFYCKRSRTPTARHQGQCIDFLKAGMKLSDEGIAKVWKDAKIEPNTLNFAQIQTAVTSTELIAQLCLNAIAKSSRQSLVRKATNSLLSFSS